MKTSLRCVVALLILSASSLVITAQGIKAPSQYFRKDSPNKPGQPAPATPASPTAPKPSAPAAAKFKDLSVNAQFFFLSDTNRAYPWTKTSATTAKNTKNGATAPIKDETPVQR